MEEPPKKTKRARKPKVEPEEAPPVVAEPVQQVFGVEIFEPRLIDGKLWLPPKFHTIDARYMLILSHPAHDDLQARELLSKQSPYREEIMNALKVSDINPNDVYVTTMVKYGIGNKSKPDKAAIAECAEQLKHEIALVNPKLIMTMGAEVFKAVMQTTRKQGDYLGEIVDSPHGCKLLANYSPGMILNQDPKLRPEFRYNFVSAKRYVNDELSYESFTYEIIRTPEENIRILQGYLDNVGPVYVGYDAEWCGAKFTDDEVMYTFQYSCEPHKAYILDISKDGREEDRALLDSMKLLLEHPRCRRMGWNIRADDKRLRHRGFNLPSETLAFDGMKACAFFDSRLAKGLETGIRHFTNYPPYYNHLNRALEQHKLKKHEMAKCKFFEPEVFWNYCAGDAVAHRTACLKMMEEMPKLQPKRVVDLYYEVYLPLSDYFLDLESNGIPIDLKVMEEITNQYRMKYAELTEQAMALITPLIPDFNPRSAPAKKKLLYEILKLDPPYYTKSGKSPKPRVWYNKQKAVTQAMYSPSTNNKCLSTLKFELASALEADPTNDDIKHKLDIIGVMLSLSRVGVFATKFLSVKGLDLAAKGIMINNLVSAPTSEEIAEDSEEEGEEAESTGPEEKPLKASYWASLANDDKIHADFFECLANFRSSSTPNVQNPASKVLSHIPDIFVPGYSSMDKDGKKKVANLVPRNLRHIFYSGGPDWHWAEVDVAGADLAIAAFLSKDQDYINDILAGNFHLKKAREYFRDDSITKDDVSRYVSSKSITFRVSYTAELRAAAIPIQSEIFAESGVMVRLQDIEFALDTWNRYATYIEYREACKAQVDEKGYIENARGLKYQFEETENFGIKAGWYNESLAFPIASELAWFLWDISVSMKKFMKSEGLWQKYCYPVNSVHDASYWLVHKDLMKDNYFPEVCKHFFTNEIKIATGDNLGMEMVVGDRWKGKDTVFANETKWNFEKKCWDWKH